MNLNSCAFTGHRPPKLPWKYNENDRNCILLKEVLSRQIAALADRGITEFLSGMAEGVDLWSSQIVLTLQETRPAINLHCILPCRNQEVGWADSTQEQYNDILKRANKIVYVNQEHTSDCMMERNRYLVDHSSILLAVYNGMRRSGTGATINYAKKQGREIIIIDPVSRSISSQTGG